MPNTSDDLFTREDPIFANEGLLKVNHLPGRGRIVGRDNKTPDLVTAVNPTIFG